MNLLLELHLDEQAEFYELYDHLSPLRQKIWRKLLDLSRRYVVNKTSQSKIAEWCQCSRSAISEAFKLFKSYGWMWLQSRGWKRSKIVQIPISKRQMDLDKKEYFHCVKATYRATHTTITRKCITGEKDPSRFSKKIDIPDYLKNTKYSLEDKWKLSLVPENFYRNGIQAVNSQISKGNKINDPYSYSVGAALRMAKESGVKIDWSLFCRTRNCNKSV